MEKLTIYLADDHNIVAQGVAALLRQIDTVGDIHIFKNGQELFNYCTSKLPDVVFLDLEMPVWDGRRTLTELKKKFTTVPCFILSMINEKYIIEDCIARGVAGYLNKDCTLHELSEAIQLPVKEVYFSINK